MQRFVDRTDAGKQLAEAVARLELADPVVLALPRGGVPVAAPVAQALGAPLDLVMVRKIGVPGHRELAAGAVADGAAHRVIWNAAVLRDLGLSEAELQAEVAAQLALIEKRRGLYLGDRAPVSVSGRDVVLVDDGIATGATVKAALKGLHSGEAASITLAVPLAPHSAVTEFKRLVDNFICLSTPEPFYAVGQGYLNFGQTSDEEVRVLTRQATARTGKGSGL